MFIEHNENPYNKNMDDCLIRAIAKGTGKPYMEIMDELIDVADAMGWEIDELRTGWQYLISNGWECCELEYGCTVKQYTKMINEPRIVIVNGHATYTEGGNVYDTWNCNRYKVKRVFRKCNS